MFKLGRLLMVKPIHSNKLSSGWPALGRVNWHDLGPLVLSTVSDCGL